MQAYQAALTLSLAKQKAVQKEMLQAENDLAKAEDELAQAQANRDRAALKSQNSSANAVGHRKRD